MIARPVPVTLLVRADRELGDVGHHRVVRELEADVLAARAALEPVLELKATNVGDEVRLPHPAGVERARAVEVLLAPVVAIAEDVRAVEHEVGVVEEIHHDRHRRDGEQPCGQRARSVVQAVRRVERNREEAALLPFEARRLFALVPHLAGAAAVQDEEVLLEQVLLWGARSARIELDEVGVIGVLGARQADVRAAGIEPRPFGEIGRAQVRYRDTGMDRDAFFLEEELIGTSSPERRTLLLFAGCRGGGFAHLRTSRFA